MAFPIHILNTVGSGDYFNHSFYPMLIIFIFRNGRIKVSSNKRSSSMSSDEVQSYVCKYCDKCFSSLSLCKEHEVIHERKPYKCQYCDKRFNSSSNCKTHEYIHTGVKPHKCKYCEKSFSWASNCKQHERTHTGVKPYKCRYCDRCFTQSSSCRRHEIRHHEWSFISASRKQRELTQPGLRTDSTMW